MDDGTMVVAVMGMLCGTGITISALAMIKSLFDRGRNGKAQNELTVELRALRDEVKELRRQHNDVILALDATLPKDPRLDALEARARAEREELERQTLRVGTR